jgi:hypothetical protein
VFLSKARVKSRLDIHIEGTSWVARNVAIW